MPGQTTNTFVYVGNAGSQEITVFRLESDGALVPVTTARVPGPALRGEASPLAVSPDKRFLYAGFRDTPFSVSTFALDPGTGIPSYLGRASVAARLPYIVTDREGRFLLGAAYHASEVTVNVICPDGTVGETQQVTATQPNAHCILPAPSNQHVLHTSLGGDVIHQDVFDARTGRLTPNNPPVRSVRPGAGPRHLIFSVDGSRVYLLCERDGSVYVFPYDAKTGLLCKEIQVASALPPGFSGKPTAADLHLTPDGRFLYASERTSATIAAYRVDPTDGLLSPIGSYPTLKEPRGFRIDPSGRYVVAAGTRTASVACYSIDQSTGALRWLKEYAAGENPNSVEIITLP